MSQKRKGVGYLTHFFKPKNSKIDDEIPIEKESSDTNTACQSEGSKQHESSANDSKASMSISTTDLSTPTISINLLDISSFVKQSLTDQEKFNALTSVWKPSADFKFPKKIEKNQKRRAQYSWTLKYSWLTYSKIEDSFYCLNCVLFAPSEIGHTNSQETNVFVKVGFNKWKDALERAKNHENTDYHKTACVRASNFKDVMTGKLTRIDNAVDIGRKTQAAENRYKITPIIDTVILCGRQGLAMRGHRDYGEFDLKNPPKENEGNFRALLRSRINAGDATLKRHFETCGKNATYISWNIQNQIIEACDKIIKQKIVSEIRDARFFTILADETEDISTAEQFSLCFRYVKQANENYTICEHFFEFQKLEGQTGRIMANAILSTLQKYNIDINNMRGQGYDGAAAMSGRFSGVQAILSEKYPTAIYVHCMSHSLNLTISDSVEITSIRNCLGVVQKVAVFFNTPKRKAILIQNVEKLIKSDSKKKHLKELCPTRWVERHDAVLTFVELFQPIINSLEEISEWEDRKSAIDAESFCSSMQRSEFIISLLCAEKMLSYSLPLSQKLQEKELDLSKAIDMAKTVIRAIKIERENAEIGFKQIFETAQNIAQSEGLNITITTPRIISRQSGNNAPAENPEEHFRRNVYIPWVERFIEQLNTRFLKHENILSSFTCLLPTGKPINKDQMSQFLKLCEFYSEDLSIYPESSLKSSIQVWYLKFSDPDQPIPIPKDAITALNLCDSTLFGGVNVLLQILCTIPITTSTAERSFSTLRRLKTYLQSTMGETRLNGLAVLNVHRQINVTAEEVLDILAQNPRKLDFVL